jgi:hypothetical protein
MEENRKLAFVDRVILEVKDKHGNVIARYDSAEHGGGNSMAKTGMAEVAGIITSGVGGTAFGYIGIGTSDAAESADHTDLQSPLKRKAATGSRVTTSFANDTAQWQAVFSSGDTLSGSNTIYEVGVFNALTGGVMLFRKVVTGVTVNWDAGEQLSVTCRCQMQQGT